MKFKLTPLEKKWVLYDVGNSAFTMMVSTIFPIYFNYLAENAGISDVDYLAYWGYATSICTLIVAILGPTLGAIADTKNFKKIIFSISMGVEYSDVSCWDSCPRGYGSWEFLYSRRPDIRPAWYSMTPCLPM